MQSIKSHRRPLTNWHFMIQIMATSGNLVIDNDLVACVIAQHFWHFLWSKSSEAQYVDRHSSRLISKLLGAGILMFQDKSVAFETLLHLRHAVLLSTSKRNADIKLRTSLLVIVFKSEISSLGRLAWNQRMPHWRSNEDRSSKTA